MKIVQCHNFYQQPGGEDQVFADEAQLLRNHGHEVVQFTRHNDTIDSMSKWTVACNTIWNKNTYREMRTLLQRSRPDVIHCTNTFPLISPAVYSAARDEHVPVVQSLHNYRMICANGLFLRDGKSCEKCLGRFVAWPAIAHRCYRDSRCASTVVVAMQATHRLKGTWTKAVNRYIALSEFSRAKFEEAGLPADKIDVKPNFISPDPQLGTGQGEFAIFVGRLSEEKGIETLLEAWAKLPSSFPLRLKIVGDGPLHREVAAAAAAKNDPRIEWLGRRSNDDVLDLMGEAACVLLPSLCYENCPKTVIESFSKGTPVIASRIGALAEMVSDEETGLNFSAGNSNELSAAVRRFVEMRHRWPAFREATRTAYETRYTAEVNYELLRNIYENTIAKYKDHSVEEHVIAGA